MSFAKPSNIQNLLPVKTLLDMKVFLPSATSKYSTKNPPSLVSDLFISGRYL